MGNGGVGPVHGKSLPLLCPRSNELFGPANMPASTRFSYLLILKKFKVMAPKATKLFVVEFARDICYFSLASAGMEHAELSGEFIRTARWLFSNSIIQYRRN